MSDISHKEVSTFFASSRNMKQFIKHCDLWMLMELRDKLNVAINEREIEQENSLTAA